MEVCSFFSEEKWLNDKMQALKAVTNHLECLKMEKEQLSDQRCCAHLFIFILNFVLIHLHFAIRPILIE